MIKPLPIVLSLGFFSITLSMNVTNFHEYTSPADSMAEYLASSDDISISNARLTAVYDEDFDFGSAGFYNGAEAISQGAGALSDGVVLSSGYADHLNTSVNIADDISGYLGSAGDEDLDNLLAPGFTSRDATILEFDFSIATAGLLNVSLSYIFGSDEYNEYAPQFPGDISLYNDVFGIFINQEYSTDIQNVSTLPGTATPISINAVNNYTNSSLFNSNDPDAGTFPTEMDGFTYPLTATFTAQGNTTYHMKIAIADAAYSDSDERGWDSWILLGKNSLTYSVPEPSTALLMLYALAALVASVAVVKKPRTITRR